VIGVGRVGGLGLDPPHAYARTEIKNPRWTIRPAQRMPVLRLVRPMWNLSCPQQTPQRTEGQPVVLRFGPNLSTTTSRTVVAASSSNTDMSHLR
jgi:hypothetical protein